MAAINITNVAIMNNLDIFTSPFKIQISFECLKELSESIFQIIAIDWKVIYVGSANNQENDQILDQFSVGPLQVGSMQFQIDVYFLIQTSSPNHLLIPCKDDILGVTALILTVTYKEQEFFRCGYYIYNSYLDQELIENDPSEVIINKVYRNVLIEKPRITRFNIDWGFQSDNAKMIEELTSQINNQQMYDQYQPVCQNMNQLDQRLGQNQFNFNNPNIF